MTAISPTMGHRRTQRPEGSKAHPTPPKPHPPAPLRTQRPGGTKVHGMTAISPTMGHRRTQRPEGSKAHTTPPDPVPQRPCGLRGLTAQGAADDGTAKNRSWGSRALPEDSVIIAPRGGRVWGPRTLPARGDRDETARLYPPGFHSKTLEPGFKITWPFAPILRAASYGCVVRALMQRAGL